MEQALLEILAALKASDATPDAAWLDRLLRRHNRLAHDPNRRVAKRRLLPYYLNVRENDHERWRSWEVDPQTEARLMRLLKMKPRRTASGVATVTVLTKPHACSSDCLYCPNDVRMPKSYLANEPACQRAEHNFFDPYLQVKARLHVLEQMGHVTDKVELIVLGGTWSDYPEGYQRWFVAELFRAASDDAPYEGGPELQTAAPRNAADNDTVAGRTAFYKACGLACEPDEVAARVSDAQAKVTCGDLTYNEAIRGLLAGNAWQSAEHIQAATWDEVEEQHRVNERAKRRVVGLVIETRPDLITATSAHTMRRLGCTKVQMGVQSLDDAVLAANRRNVNAAQIARAFSILRIYGFKLHIHFMVNLMGATPESDVAGYRQLVADPRFCPDEVKLYPCALVESARLMEEWERGRWQAYSEGELIDILVKDVLATPAHTRISRMIRDISSTDIVAGNKKTNLRQLVESRLEGRRDEVREIRMREIAANDVSHDELLLSCEAYDTAVSEERFLQWETSEGRIAGFCRLSLPDEQAALELMDADPLPTSSGTAMIREVHVYGRVTGIGATEQGAAQHAGLGKALVEEACRQARDAGYTRIAVISAVGTRGYYRALGFEDAGLYQIRQLG